MREIKFRLWEHGTMYDSDCCDFSIELCGYGNFNGILMQYTGLKDKSGKEIYEGDIIEIPREYGPIVIRNFIEDTFFLAECKGDSLGRVIGNIYENPELLENAG